MKKIAKLMTVLAVVAFTFASCEDVPTPFGTVTPPTTDSDDGNTELPYTSVNLNSGWTLEAVTADQPWSQGSSYVQATGYQKWDGAETKSNRAVEGWLISPAISTKGYENVKFSFDHTIKYATYTGWEANHKVYVCNNYDETNFSAATWVEITDFKPVASPYPSSDWTLYSSGELQLPASMVGQEAIHIGFYFKAPAEKSTTWELKNFNIAEGIADNSGGSGEDPSAETIGSKDNPISVADALTRINALEDGGKTASKAYVKGKVVKVTTNQTNFEKFGNLNYLISDDGTESNTVTVYSGDGLDGAKFTSITDLAAGDEVIVLGALYKYVNKSGQVTPEIDSGNYLVSLVKGSGGSGTTPTGEPKGSGTLADPFNVVAIAQEAAKLGDKEVSTQDYYFKGKICSVKYTFSAQYGTATFNVSDDGKTGGTEFTCYSVYTLGNQPWIDGNTQVAVGDEVIICGKITNFGGTLETSSKNAYIYSLNGKTEDSGTSGGGGSGGGDTGSADITAAFGDLDCSDVASIKLSDGTTISLAQEDGSNPPVYHASTKILRIYARNSLTINAGSKKINKVELAYDTYNGTAYKGNDEMYGEAGSDKLTPTKDDKNVTFNGVNNSTLKVVNWREAGTTGGTQLRLTGISITYVK